MYVRLLMPRTSPLAISAVRKFFQQRILPAFRSVPGAIFTCLAKEPASRNLSTFTIWTDRAHAEAFESSQAHRDILNDLQNLYHVPFDRRLFIREEMRLESIPAQDFSHFSDPMRTLPTLSPDPILHMLQRSGPTTTIRLTFLPVPDSNREAFLESYLAKAEPNLKAQPGCLHILLTENTARRSELVNISFWNDRYASENFESSGAFSSILDLVSHTFPKVRRWSRATGSPSWQNRERDAEVRVELYEFLSSTDFEM